MHEPDFQDTVLNNKVGIVGLPVTELSRHWFFNQAMRVAPRINSVSILETEFFYDKRRMLT